MPRYRIYRSRAGKHTDYRAINIAAGTGGDPVPIYHPATVPSSYYSSARTKRLARNWKPSYSGQRNPYVKLSQPATPSISRRMALMPKTKRKVYRGARGGRYILDRVTKTRTGRKRAKPKVVRKYI